MLLVFIGNIFHSAMRVKFRKICSHDGKKFGRIWYQGVNLFSRFTLVDKEEVVKPWKGIVRYEFINEKEHLQARSSNDN